MIDCWKRGLDFTNFTLYVAKSDGTDWRYRRLVDRPMYSYPFDAFGSALIKMPGDFDDIYCENWRYMKFPFEFSKLMSMNVFTSNFWFSPKKRVGNSVDLDWIFYP